MFLSQSSIFLKLILHAKPFQCPPAAAIIFLPDLLSLNRKNGHKHVRFQITMSCSSSTCSSSNSEGRWAALHQVPGLESNEIDVIAEETFRRYALPSAAGLLRTKRSGTGLTIVWFRNDLRVLDNEALLKAWSMSEMVLPVYCVDPRLFRTTYNFGFPKTGALRAKFLIQSLDDLRKNLKWFGLDLLIRHGKPEEILPSLAKTYAAHTIWAQKETCSEEVDVEKWVTKSLETSSGVTQSRPTKLEFIWGSTLYHIDDLPFPPATGLPDVYTQFRKCVESKSSIRGCIKLPASLGPAPEVDDWGTIPSLHQLGLHDDQKEVSKGLVFLGGERASLCRVHEYIWKKDQVKIYKETRNGMLGPDYSTKFSPWLASGSLSPRFIYEEVMRYEKERVANDSTYWILFELIWRDYFRFLSIKCGNSLFHPGGPRQLLYTWNQDDALFESWRQGRTGYPLIDANMKELSTTGFMSNRGRQIVCSFLVRDMGIDWRMGAEWFETCLLDYDPSSNYGNWTYGAGVGNDPREDRYFSIPKQAQVYDPEGIYVAYWLPELRRLPRDKRNFPGMSYIKPVVPLKFGNNGSKHSRGGKKTSAR